MVPTTPAHTAPTPDDEPIVTGQWIDGEARDAADGDTYAIHNPARPAELVGRAASATVDDVNAAVRATHAAYPAWAVLSYDERAERLLAIADALVADEADVAHRSRLFRREHGKILQDPEGDAAGDDAARGSLPPERGLRRAARDRRAHRGASLHTIVTR